MSEVVTGDAVVLDVPVAQLPLRAVSSLIDVTVQVVVSYVGLFVVILGATSLDTALLTGLVIGYYVLALVGYPVLIETLTHGRSLGKMVMGLRVVSDDGGPVRLRQSFVRALTGVIEIFGLGGAPAVICSLISKKGKRIGDVFAGTMVISERGPKLPASPLMPAALAGWAGSLDLSGLTAQQAELARQFLQRAPGLSPQMRDAMASQIAADVYRSIAPPPPPGTPPQYLLAAVLAERHRRAMAAATVPPGWTPAPGPAPGFDGPPRPPAGPSDSGFTAPQ